MGQSNIQQKAASTVATIVLVIVVGWLVLLALSSMQESGTVGQRPRLDPWWAVLKWWISDSDVIAKIFAGLLLLLSVATQFLARLHSKIWSLIAVVLLCLSGMAAAVLFLSYGNDISQDIFKQFRSVVEKQPEEVRDSVKAVVYSTIGWLVSFMAIQLGISLKKPDGALKALRD